ncbi:MAG: WG repeat-containing protein, partial [Bacteroidales bacterium]|nr:WG repeat-containing protein [Bacteroidales bacterium]
MKQFNFLCVALCFFCTLHGQSMYKLSTDFKYDSLKALDNEYFAVKENGLWGIIKGNEIVIPCKYEQIDNFGDNIVAFIQNGRVGFADINGNLIAEPQYLLEVNYNRSDKSPLNVFSNGSALVYNGEKFILLGKDGKSIVEDNIEILSKVGNTAIYRTNGAYGLMDALGNPLTEAKYLQIQPVIEDRLYAYIGVRDGLRVWGFLNSKGEMKSHAYFDDVQLINKGDKFYIKAYLPTGKQALFDENGEILFQPLYQVIEPTLYPSYFNIT